MHKQNRNGALFEKFLNENNLTCINTLPLTTGLITRKRKCLNDIKESTIDFYVVCDRVLPFVNQMNIDDCKHHMLTNYGNIGNNGTAINSDHYLLTMDVKLASRPVKKVRTEILNFNDINSQLIFKEVTSNTDVFTKCFSDVQNVTNEAEKWMDTLKSHCKKAFKKIRIRTKNIRSSAADKIISERNKLVRHGRIKESRILDGKIAKIISEEGRSKAIMFNKFTDNNMSACLSEMWKMKKSIFPKKTQTLPSSKINYQGRLVSELSELTKLLGEEYGRVRLRKRPSHPLNLEGKKIRKILLKLKLNLARKRSTKPFEMKDLEDVLKSLKSKKARDPDGIDRSIFKSKTIGSNLKNSILKLFNSMKEGNTVPLFMKKKQQLQLYQRKEYLL